MVPPTDRARPPQRRRSTVAAHGGLVVASAAVIAAASRSNVPADFPQIAMWFAATGVAGGVFALPLERILVSHARPSFGLLAVTAGAAALTSAAIGLLGGPAVAATASAWAVGAVLIAPARAGLIRQGRWHAYGSSVGAEAAARTVAALSIVAGVPPTATLLLLSGGIAFASLPPLLQRLQGSAAEPLATADALQRAFVSSALATLIIYTPALVQEARAPELLDTTMPTAMAARAALWLSPALTAIAAHRTVSLERHNLTWWPAVIPAATALTAIGASLIGDTPPAVIPAALATTATALVLICFTTQQQLIAEGRLRAVQGAWFASAGACITASFVLPATPTYLFASQLAAAVLTVVLLRRPAKLQLHLADV